MCTKQIIEKAKSLPYSKKGRFFQSYLQNSYFSLKFALENQKPTNY